MTPIVQWSIFGAISAVGAATVGTISYFGGRSVGARRGAKAEYVLSTDGKLWTIDAYRQARNEQTIAIANGQPASPVAPLVPQQAHVLQHLQEQPVQQVQQVPMVQQYQAAPQYQQPRVPAQPTASLDDIKQLLAQVLAASPQSTAPNAS